MSSNTSPIVDTLSSLANSDIQRIAARMAQEVFTATFRQSVGAEAAQAGKAMAEIESRCANWCSAGGSDDARALRLALLISGLDQWGLAYSQAFNVSAIPALSALIGALRSRLDTRSDARFQWFFNQIDQVEADAIDFKVELRRGIHLALWHAMAACETESDANAIIQALGSMFLALNERMSELGWRLVADALANIQVRLLDDPAASAVAQEGTRQLFESLRRSLPQERYQTILAHSAQVVLAWQQSKRSAQPES
ncbi:MAG: hypothetical protein H6R10_1319 [Rhodocyclaceae bacterium]|nr:hypothetical protein [Rhodocyclaceae bacterium]